MRVIIAGSRPPESVKPEDKPAWYEWALVVVTHACEDSGLDITEVVSGNANGFDKVGEEWASRNGRPVKTFIPNYQRLGRFLAPKARNRQMAYYADALIACTFGTGGTAHIIGTMRELGKPIRVIRLRPEAWRKVPV